MPFISLSIPLNKNIIITILHPLCFDNIFTVATSMLGHVSAPNFCIGGGTVLGEDAAEGGKSINKMISIDFGFNDVWIWKTLFVFNVSDRLY